MPARYVHRDDPDGPVYYVLESRLASGPGVWWVVCDNTRNGGERNRLDTTRDRWHRELLDGVFVPLESEG